MNRSPSVLARGLIAAAFAAVTAVTAAAAEVQYPTKPVRLVSGYAPGGTTSLVGRLIGEKLTESWSEQFILDNRPGGGTLIAGELVARAAPDGYTLMLVDSVHVLAPLLLKAPFDPIKDFVPVGTIAATEFVLLVHPSLPPKNFSEFQAYAKARPGKLNYATPAIGGSQHLASEIFNIAAGIQTQHIPYKGAGPALVALIGGEVDFYFATVATGVPHVKSGKARGIAVTGKERSPLLPDVATFDQQGLSNFYNHKRAPFGIVAPAGTPQAIIDKLSAEVAKYVAQPQFRERLIGLGLVPYLATSAEYGEVLKAGLAWNVNTIKLLKERGVKFE